jgi:hypothetical protein
MGKRYSEGWKERRVPKQDTAEAFRRRARDPHPRDTPVCPYCQKLAQLVSGDLIYPQLSAVRDRLFWRCAPCNAHVGCHPHSAIPMGTLADTDLRRLRIAAHGAFDPYWRGRYMTRSEAYAWLADTLEIPLDQAHIAMLTPDQCRRVALICQEAA